MVLKEFYFYGWINEWMYISGGRYILFLIII